MSETVLPYGYGVIHDYGDLQSQVVWYWVILYNITWGVGTTHSFRTYASIMLKAEAKTNTSRSGLFAHCSRYGSDVIFCIHYHVQHHVSLIYIDSFLHTCSLCLPFPLPFQSRSGEAEKRCRVGIGVPWFPLPPRGTETCLASSHQSHNRPVPALPTHQKARVNENEKRAAGRCGDDEVEGMDWVD